MKYINPLEFNILCQDARVGAMSDEEVKAIVDSTDDSEVKTEWKHDAHGHTLHLFKHLAICVFRRYHCWMFTCSGLGFLNKGLVSNGIEEAKEEAAKLVLAKIREFARELPSAEEKLEMLGNL